MLLLEAMLYAPLVPEGDREEGRVAAVPSQLTRAASDHRDYRNEDWVHYERIKEVYEEGHAPATRVAWGGHLRGGWATVLALGS